MSIKPQRGWEIGLTHRLIRLIRASELPGLDLPVMVVAIHMKLDRPVIRWCLGVLDGLRTCSQPRNYQLGQTLVVVWVGRVANSGQYRVSTQKLAEDDNSDGNQQ